MLEKSFNVKAIDSYLGMNSTELRQIVRHREWEAGRRGGERGREIEGGRAREGEGERQRGTRGTEREREREKERERQSESESERD